MTIDIPCCLPAEVGGDEVDRIEFNVPVLLHDNPAEDECDTWQFLRPEDARIYSALSGARIERIEKRAIEKAREIHARQSVSEPDNFKP